MKILTAKQMGEVDRLTTERYGIPSILLMENAGRSVVDEMEKSCRNLSEKRILVICGIGNNGGDGLVVARLLVARACRPEVWILGNPADFKGDALENWKMFQALGLPVQIAPDAESRTKLLESTAHPDVIVDALFGTGLSKPIGAGFRGVIEWMNRARPRCLVVSVDLPSGVFADLALLEGITAQADITVTFTALKPGLVFFPAAGMAGKVVVACIGSPSALMENREYRMELIDRSHARRALPPRSPESHKGMFGHIFALSGSRDKSGAAIMTGVAAARAGAGLVTMMLPQSLRPDLVGKVPELMTVWLPETDEGTADASALDFVLDRSSQSDVIVVGPGLSTNPATQQLVRQVVRRAPVPVLLDADGINAFAGHVEELRNDGEHPIIITPHPGEMGRLLNLSTAEIQRRRCEIATECATKYGIHVVLKGFQTLVASPGGRILVNSTGNAGMATGGTGDILAGMMARFVAGWKYASRADVNEELADFLAAAVYLHGLAGDLAAAEMGEESLMAMDLLSHLAQAFKRTGQE